LEAALEVGMLHWDTAGAYGKGHSEKLIGEILPECRERVFLASKAFIPGDARGIGQRIERSLQNLRTDYIDLYYIHWPRPDTDMRPAMAELERCRKAGKIRYIGVSNFSVDQLQSLQTAGNVDAYQIGYNLLWQRPQTGIIPYCRQENISLVTYSSLAQGILTGKFGPNPTFPKGDNRPYTVLFQPEIWPTVYATAQKLSLIAEKNKIKLPQLAIEWLRSQPGIHSILLGARNARQVRENREYITYAPIPESDWQEMQRLGQELMALHPNSDTMFH
jgi:aryl-alcohol dehydrogenase-like predicted oxidoreductase